MVDKSKKAQVTIFIILAIMIVALGIIIYMFYPQIKASFGFVEQNPNAFMQSCLQDKVQETASTLMPQGGSLNPEFYYLYQDVKIKYLCYTNEYYKLCTVQEPMLKESIESEIKTNIQKDVDECLNELERSFAGRGYQTSLRKGVFIVELLPKRIVVTLNSSLVLRQGDDTETYSDFKIVLNNNLYELVSIANSILGFESTAGDVEITSYMNYYRDLKVEKLKQGDGTKIYILTDRNTEDKFQFASRSQVWPPGY